MNAFLVLALTLSFCLAGVPTAAFAVCNQTSASLADRNLWETHGCWVDYILWQYREYDVHSPHWDDRGFFDACNQNLEYPKHWNATYLINYGLADNPSQSWHGTVDYAHLSNAARNEFKFDLYHTASQGYDLDGTTFYGKWLHHEGTPNEITTSCFMFDETLDSALANPASRAGDFMHEGWHGWEQEHGYSGDHFANPEGGRCTVAGVNCDYFYFHGLNAYRFGAMYDTDGTANRIHSPNQAEVEFLCDVADQSKSWVPASVRMEAKSDADQRAVTRFINGPGYGCGSPRPL